MLQPASAKPGDLVTARTAPYTPPTFTLRQREKPFHKAIRLYLVPDRIAGQVRGRFDRRLHYVGSLTPDRHARGVLTFGVAWLPREGFTGDLTVRGERLEAPGRLRVLSVNWGHSSTGRGGWASAVRFPDEGCSRITGRVRDISLTYVVQVVGG